MKLHFVPTSTTSRPVVLFFTEAKIPFEPVIVDFAKREHKTEPFVSLNPMAQVPVLEDDGFILIESSSIMKYVADKFESPAYPKAFQERARVNERMDWFNTDFFREFGYNFIYPQVFRHHRRDEAGQGITVEWGRKKAENCLEFLDKKLIGQNPYVCGDKITLADYFGAELVHTGELVRVNLARFPNVARWMDTMRQLPSWKTVNAGLDAFATSLREKSFVTIS